MLRSKLGLSLIAWMLTIAGVGCGGVSPVSPVIEVPDSGVDAGGAQPDGGLAADAGLDPDAGMDTDAGEEMDGGVELDGGADPDGGMLPDAGGSDMDAGVTPLSLCQETAQRRCDYYIRCATDQLAQADLNENRTNASLASGERAACEAFFSSQAGCEISSAGWELGRAQLDPVAYAQCIDASYPANTCVRDLNLVSALCAEMPFLSGATPNGSLCTFDNECSSGFCTATPSSCGQCTTYLADGANCTRHAECDPSTSYCALPLFGGGAGTCAPFVATGAACNDDPACGPGNVCAVTGVFPPRTCQPAKALGAPCQGGRYECERTAARLTVCSVANGTGTCVPAFASEDGTCGSGEFVPNVGAFPMCPETQFCSGGLCVDRRAAGQPCTNTSMCAQGLFCDGNVCVGFRAAGEPCNGNSAVCQSMLTCQGAACAPHLAELGEACGSQIPCAEGFCDPTTSLCVDRLPVGASCTADTQCASFDCSTTCQDACWD